MLVYAFHRGAERHEEYKAWLEELASGDAAFGVSELVLSGFVRVVTHPSAMVPSQPVDLALEFTEGLLAQPNCVRIRPGPRHWAIFTALCRAARARGNMVSDAYHAALAIESGSEWITTDRDYARFPGLRWRHPLA